MVVEVEPAPTKVEKVGVETRSPAILTAKRVEEMIRARQEFQIAKFRTTCTDCVPNF